MTHKSRKGADHSEQCCSFCGTPASEAALMFNGGEGASICSSCIEHGYGLLLEHNIIAGAKPRNAKGGKGGIAGDAKFDEVEPIVEAITPVPGGVGSVTTSVLMKHVVEAAEKI